MNKKFVREVLKRLPSYEVAKGHFFFARPFEHVLAGFAWEKPPSGLYIWKFTFPIFDEANDLHLSYSERLPTGKIYVTGMGQEGAIAEEFVGRVAPYLEQTSQLRNLDRFVDYLSGCALGNPNIRRGYALALLLSGNEAAALQQLELCAQRPVNEQFDASIKKWVRAIREGSARELLLNAEEKLLEKLGIERTS